MKAGFHSLLTRDVRFGTAPVFLSLAFVVSGCDGRDAAPPQTRVRNVVLVSIDTLRPDHLEAYGYERPTSPYLRELAESGVLFEQAVAQSPWTLPSHAAMLTSLYPSAMELGTWNRPGKVPEDVVTLAERLAAGGLRTRALVNAGFVSKHFGFDQGFEKYGDLRVDMATTVQRALRWVERLGEQERFFLFLHTYDVHEYAPPPETAEVLVRPYSGPLAEIGDQLASLVQDRDIAPEELVASLTPEDRRYLVDLYDASLLSVDRALAGLSRRLAELGRLEDTLIVVTSDHGEEFFEHGATGHGYTLYDENVLVPLILAHPGLTPRRVAEQVRSIDIAPTVVELCGLEPDPSWQGASLVALLDDRAEDPAGERPAFSGYAHQPFVSVRHRGLKYIVGEESRVQLYDLATDPSERADLAGRGDAREADLEQQLQHWMRDQEDARATREGELVELDGELASQLRMLGYAGDTEEPAADVPGNEDP